MSGRELEADEFVCVSCGEVSVEHPKDGMSECAGCVQRAVRRAFKDCPNCGRPQGSHHRGVLCASRRPSVPVVYP